MTTTTTTRHVDVIPEQHQLKFQLEQPREWNLHTMMDGSWQQAIQALPADAPWSIPYIEGNGTGAFGVRTDHFGTRQWIIGVAKGGYTLGYLLLEDRDYITLTPHVSLPLTLPLPELVVLIKEAVQEVQASEVAHLFSQPFALSKGWKMGAATFDAR